MNINWKVRFANENFWASIIPAILLLIQLILDLFGVRMDLGDIGNKLISIVNAVFACLTILGVVTDPTTTGIHDSERAMGYDAPWNDITDNVED